MSSSIIITVVTILLTIITIGHSYPPTTTVPASHLAAIYKNCQTSAVNKFCIGGDVEDLAFPEGTGCLKTKKCDAIVSATRSATPDTNGHSIEWKFLVTSVRASEGGIVSVNFGLTTEKHRLQNDSLDIILSNHSNKTFVGFAKAGVYEEYNATEHDTFLVKDSVVIESSATSPSMVLVRFTTRSVIKYPPTDFEADTSDDLDISIEVRRHLRSFNEVGSYKLSPLKIFSGSRSAVTINNLESARYTQASKVLPGSHLDTIYDSCQSTAVNKFCIGGKGNDTGFPEGCGCLKDKNCEVIITATRLDKEDTNGHGIEWQSCITVDRGHRFYVFLVSKEQIQAVTKLTRESVIAAIGNRGDHGFATTRKADGKQVNMEIKEMANVTSTPPSTCLTVTSPLVIKLSTGDKIDLINEQLFPTIFGIPTPENGTIAQHPSYHRPSSVFLFQRDSDGKHVEPNAGRTLTPSAFSLIATVIIIGLHSVSV